MVAGRRNISGARSADFVLRTSVVSYRLAGVSRGDRLPAH